MNALYPMYAYRICRLFLSAFGFWVSSGVSSRTMLRSEMRRNGSGCDTRIAVERGGGDGGGVHDAKVASRQARERQEKSFINAS